MQRSDSTLRLNSWFKHILFWFSFDLQKMLYTRRNFKGLEWKKYTYMIPFPNTKWSCTEKTQVTSRKHAYIIMAPFNPTAVKLGFTGVYITFLFLHKNIDCGYSLESPCQGGSNKYPESVFQAEIRKYQNFLSENFHFLVVKFSVYLNRRVFVMIYRMWHICLLIWSASLHNM